jgi:hypothetical protein
MATEHKTLRVHLFGSILVAGALSLSAPVGAGDDPTTFETLDADGNGYISEKEAAARNDLLERWIVIDTNTDNQLDITEFSAFESEKPAAGAAPQ